MSLLPEIKNLILEFYCSNLSEGIYWHGSFPKVNILTVMPLGACLVCKFWHEYCISKLSKYQYVLCMYHAQHIEIIDFGLRFKRKIFSAFNDDRGSAITYESTNELLFQKISNIIQKKFNVYVEWYDCVLLSLENYEKRKIFLLRIVRMLMRRLRKFKN